jgi:HAD superfamily hydrolase (TIGR01509 family)
MLSALILDFDGLILDTEWPGYLAWQEAYAAHGFSFSEEVWAGYVGTAHHADPAAELQRLLRQQGQVPPPLAEIHKKAHRRREELIFASDIMPGVPETITAARHAGLRLGIASSSDHARVREHLNYLASIGHDIASAFDAIVTRDMVGDRPKPDPAVYVEVLRRLAVDPSRAIAVEDSANGVRAARGAGIFTVAVPNRATRNLNFSPANQVLTSLAEFDLEHFRHLFSTQPRRESTP